jgi:hypothetical protein
VELYQSECDHLQVATLGAILSDLLQHLPQFTHLETKVLDLGPQGALAMQPGLRSLSNRALECLSLFGC